MRARELCERALVLRSFVVVLVGDGGRADRSAVVRLVRIVPEAGGATEHHGQTQQGQPQHDANHDQ